MIEQSVAAGPSLGIYIHWPFCVRRCNYCSFVSSVDPDLQRPYYDALIGEIQAAGRLYDGQVDSIFIGGGTPSSAPPGAIAGVLRNLRNEFNVAHDAEISIEANPDSVDLDSLQEWRSAGVNRLSMGLQSTHAGHLFRLGRVHTLRDFENAYANARDSGFQNINVDLMYGLPLQTASEWKQTLRFVRTLQPEHISCYGLLLEDGTRLYERVMERALPVPDEALSAKMYTQASNMLRSAGFEHYEISNFARPGKQCRHNIKYWSLDNYLGLGAAAHSLIGLFRFANTDSVNGYIDERSDGALHYAQHEFVTIPDRQNEFVMLKTRLSEGFSEQEYHDEFGEDFMTTHEAGMEKSLEEGLVEVRDGRIIPTMRGFLFQNQLALNLMTS